MMGELAIGLDPQRNLIREVMKPRNLWTTRIGINGDSLAVLIHKTIARAEKMQFGNQRQMAGRYDPPSPRALAPETKI